VLLRRVVNCQNWRAELREDAVLSIKNNRANVMNSKECKMDNSMFEMLIVWRLDDLVVNADLFSVYCCVVVLVLILKSSLTMDCDVCLVH